MGSLVRLYSTVCAAAALLGCSSSSSESDGAAASPAPDAAGGCAGLSGYAYDDASACFEDEAPLPDSVCARAGEPPSSGVYATCLVAPDGAMFHLLLRGDKRIVGSGWTHSGYGTVASTLSDADTSRCTDSASRSPAWGTDAGESWCSG